MSSSTKRFSGRAKNYSRFRPHYPSALLDKLVNECGLSRDTVVADVGAGTGIFAELFLENGNSVFAVEPNPDMRNSLAQLVTLYGRLTVVDGSAEATTLAEGSADLVVVGQAFHWFDPIPTRREFARILRPTGQVALAWIQRDIEASAFASEYESLVRKYAVDQASFGRDAVDLPTISRFFDHEHVAAREFQNQQRLNYAALCGLLQSMSMVPNVQHATYEPMMHELGELFSRFESEGAVVMDYRTKLFYGKLSPMFA